MGRRRQEGRKNAYRLGLVKGYLRIRNILRWWAFLGDVTAAIAEMADGATNNTVFHNYTVSGTHMGTQGVSWVFQQGKCRKNIKL